MSATQPNHYFKLGATLYTPANHKDLNNVMQGKASEARSIVICLEDSIKESEIEFALKNLNNALDNLPENKPSPDIKRFIRPRSPEMLKQILNLKNIEKIDGFVLPKFDLDNIDLYEQIITQCQAAFFLYMPTLESKQTFDPSAMKSLCHKLKQWTAEIPCLRIGGNDLMNHLGIKRLKGMTIYDTPIRLVIDQLVLIFRLEGFELSAPVFDITQDDETLTRELNIDLAYGFLAKTAIHPSQVIHIENIYKNYYDSNISQAHSVLDENLSAVFSFNGQMMEKTCHKQWANKTRLLAQNYISN